MPCCFALVTATDGGDEVVRIMSTADPAGLTLEQSALLGQAVQTCDIETDFTFPDPGSTGSVDDSETTHEAEGSEDGSASGGEGTGSANDSASTDEGVGSPSQ